MNRSKDNILKFIDQFKDLKKFFLKEKCYWFARILLDRFSVNSTCLIMYNHKTKHFACSIDDVLYDASGIIPSDGFISWKNYKYDNPCSTLVLYKDYILFDDAEKENLSENNYNYYIYSRYF